MSDYTITMKITDARLYKSACHEVNRKHAAAGGVPFIAEAMRAQIDRMDAVSNLAPRGGVVETGEVTFEMTVTPAGALMIVQEAFEARMGKLRGERDEILSRYTDDPDAAAITEKVKAEWDIPMRKLFQEWSRLQDVFKAYL